MADLRVIGQVAGYEDAETRLTITYPSDWRDERGLLPPPAYMLRALPGQAFEDISGGAGQIIGSDNPAHPAPAIQITYVLLKPGMLPLARSVTRHAFSNTNAAGVFDFTVPDAQQVTWGGGGGVAPTVTMLPGVGPKGDAGNTIMTAPGDPAGGLGDVGDLYINELTYDLWKKDGLNGWVVLFNLKGTQGARGPEGPKGADGKSFPAPTAQQLGFLAVADGSQPNGFSWYSPATVLGASSRKLAALVDVDISMGLSDGQILAWNADANKFMPYTIPKSEVLPNSAGLFLTIAQGSGLNAWGIKIIDTMEANKPYIMRSDYTIGSALAIKIPDYIDGNYLIIKSEVAASLHNANGNYIMGIDNGLYGENGGGAVIFNPNKGDIFYLLPRGPIAGARIVAEFSDGLHGGTITSGDQVYISHNHYGWNVYENSSFKWATLFYAREQLEFVASSSAPTFSVHVIRYNDETATVGTIIETINIPADGIRRVFRSLPLPNYGYYGLELSEGSGRIMLAAPIVPGFGVVNDLPSDLHPARVRVVEDCPEGGAAILDDGINPPRWIYRRLRGAVFYGAALSEAP